MSDIVERGRDSITTCYVEKIDPHDLCDELADEIERLRDRIAKLEKVEVAARKLKWYQCVGGPDYPDWDLYFNDLFAALHDLDEQGGDDE